MLGFGYKTLLWKDDVRILPRLRFSGRVRYTYTS